MLGFGKSFPHFAARRRWRGKTPPFDQERRKSAPRQARLTGEADCGLLQRRPART